MADIISIVLPDGSARRLGNNRPSKLNMRALPLYGTTPSTPLIPRSEWKGLIDAQGNSLDSGFLPPCHDQDGIGMCNCSATTGAMESQRSKQGLPFIELSAGDLYHRISGGRDDGSTLEDGLHESMSVGVATTKTTPYLDWRKEHQGAAEERKSYRVLEAFLAPDFDHCMSGVLSGFDLISGILWYDNYTPDRDGWLPIGRGNSGGHAVHGFKGVYRGSDFGIAHQNSWTTQFGINGKCVFPERCYQDESIGGWWLVRAVTDEGGVIVSGG